MAGSEQKDVCRSRSRSRSRERSEVEGQAPVSVQCPESPQQPKMWIFTEVINSSGVPGSERISEPRIFLTLAAAKAFACERIIREIVDGECFKALNSMAEEKDRGCELLLDYGYLCETSEDEEWFVHESGCLLYQWAITALPTATTIGPDDNWHKEAWDKKYFGVLAWIEREVEGQVLGG